MAGWIYVPLFFKIFDYVVSFFLGEMEVEEFFFDGDGGFGDDHIAVVIDRLRFGLKYF